MADVEETMQLLPFDTECQLLKVEVSVLILAFDDKYPTDLAPGPSFSINLLLLVFLNVFISYLCVKFNDLLLTFLTPFKGQRSAWNLKKDFKTPN